MQELIRRAEVFHQFFMSKAQILRLIADRIAKPVYLVVADSPYFHFQRDLGDKAAAEFISDVDLPLRIIELEDHALQILKRALREDQLGILFPHINLHWRKLIQQDPHPAEDLMRDVKPGLFFRVMAVIMTIDQWFTKSQQRHGNLMNTVVKQESLDNDLLSHGSDLQTAFGHAVDNAGQIDPRVKIQINILAGQFTVYNAAVIHQILFAEQHIMA
ncbi:hypothetical protein DSECCO2_525740 [anaerobic digester metagenome]